MVSFLVFLERVLENPPFKEMIYGVSCMFCRARGMIFSFFFRLVK